MARSYRMTPARRAALRKAQAASARKRKGKGTRPESRNQARRIRRRKIVRTTALTGVAIGLGAAGVGYGRSETHAVRKGVKKSVRKKGLTGAENRAARITHGKRVKPLVRHNVRRQRARKRAA